MMVLALAAAIAATALLRTILARRLPLADDEAYYWLWSQHLAWGYPDHPPMIAALIALATWILGDSPGGIRGVTLVLASATPLLVYVTGQSLFDHSTGLRSALLVVGVPILALGTLFAFPDVPLGFFWVLGLWTGWRALQHGGWWWLAAGVALAMALQSKLTAVFLVMGLIGAWAAGPWRRSLRDPAWYLGMAVAGILIAPMIHWNVRHDWWMIRTILHGPSWIPPRSIPENLFLFLGAQLVYYGPLVLPLVMGIVVAIRRFRDPAWRYLAWMSAPILLAVLISALGAKAKPHWPAPAYITAAVAAGAAWPQWRQRPKLVWIPGVLAGLLTAVLFGVTLFLPGIDVTGAFGRWDQVARAADREAAGRGTFILTDGYHSASQIAYHLRGRVPVTTLGGVFALWERPGQYTGQAVVYVNEKGGAPGWHLDLICRNIREVGAVELSPGRVLMLYGCEDFRRRRHRLVENRARRGSLSEG